jgi:hypothetical protein
MLAGDVDAGRDYIKATVGFEKLGAATGKPEKSLIRMLGQRSNPQTHNLFGTSTTCRNRPGSRCM